MSESTALTNWDEELAKQAREVAAAERPSVSNISARAGVLSYQGTPIPGNKLPVIVVATAYENQYFPSSFDPNKTEAPTCFALSIDGLDMVPHENSREKQADSCAECPMFKWGSDPKGGKGKACKSKRRLVLIPANALEDGVEKAEMAQLTLPVTSVKNWGNYVNRLAATVKRPPWAVITEVKTQPHVKNQFEIVFEPVSAVDSEHLGALSVLREAADNIALRPYEIPTEEAEAEEEPKPKGKRKY